MTEIRPDEQALNIDPAGLPPDAGIVFIGRVRSPHHERQHCPRNMAAAHENPQPADIVIDPAYQEGLAGLEGYSHAIVLTWLDRSRRDLIIQKPRHASQPRGVFATRSPVRPNPVGVHVVQLRAVDIEAGVLHLAAVDVLDGTPVIDVKPYYASSDSVADAIRGEP